MALDPVITVDKLSHYFGDGALRKQILHEVSAEFYPGEIVILTGPSGSGKTTVLSLVGALRSVQEGSVSVLGLELRGAAKAAMGQVRRKIGFIFQAHNLIDALTARQNVQMSVALLGPVSREIADAKAEAMLKAVGLEARINYYRTNSRVARNSVSPSRARWSVSRESSWRMNPPRPWTRSPAARLSKSCEPLPSSKARPSFW